MTPEELEIAHNIAKEFHETYEHLAPNYGYETREESAVPWVDVPEKNKMLMVGVIAHLLDKGIIYVATKPRPKIGELQTDKDGSEWVVVGSTRLSISRVRRYSLAHQVHAEGSPTIAKSLEVTDART